MPGKTLLIFDEIQSSPNAITSLKYFCEDMPRLHIIAAGSLLGVSLNREEVSFPVGKVERITMYPLSFKEFVIANGDGDYINALDYMDNKREIPELYTEPLRKHLLNYYIIGGMPAAVVAWINTHSYEEVESIQSNIIEDYENDFAKYAPIKEVPKIRQIWHSIPEQLAKDNNKFVFSHVKKGGRARELEDALEWLIDAGLVYSWNLWKNQNYHFLIWQMIHHLRYSCQMLDYLDIDLTYIIKLFLRAMTDILDSKVRLQKTMF